GFSLDSVVREYGALRDAIVVTARALGVSPTFDELQCVFGSTISGIARAVSEYARQRDAEQQRLHNEHIAFIAHELRNPLASATTAYEVLKLQGALPAEARASLALGRGLLSMQELIDHALSVARVASGIELRREPVVLSELLAEAELVAAGEAEARKVQIHVHVEADVTIDGDRRLLRSAINNIVRNAVKYTALGSEIEIRTRVDGDHVLIEVEDGCGGLPAGKLEAAFAPFVRLTTREPGFGLGLAIAKQAVDAHAGTIRVQNLPGKGCIFVLELPIARAA
ncbi:MAG: HAMP domain-containing histidine kinase, partial [Myxococcales bacterium]|nr:HAMP domain-containing histidine kinase [Myxococcales bacterium]